MVRPKTKPYQFTIRVTENDWNKLTDLSDQLSTLRTTLVGRAVEVYLARFYPGKNSTDRVSA